MYCKAQSHNWQLQVNQTGQAVCMQVFDWSMTARKVIVIAENTMSKSKTVLEMTATGLDAPWDDNATDDTETAMTAWSNLANSGVVLEVGKISHACFVYLVLQYSPHTLVNWI